MAMTMAQIELIQYYKSQGLCTKCGSPAYIKPDGTPAILCADCRRKKNERNKRDCRINYLHAGNRWIRGLNKRMYTEICEVCGNGGILVYHHWDDNNPSKGLWLCRERCHHIAEAIDQIGRSIGNIDIIKLITMYRAKREALDICPLR